MPGDILANNEESRRLVEQESSRVPLGTLVLVGGNAVTEDGISSYQTAINRPPGIRDNTGVDKTGWGLWSRGWTREEHRHGKLLQRYLQFSDPEKIDYDEYENVVIDLVGNGFDSKTGLDPYLSIVMVRVQLAPWRYYTDLRRRRWPATKSRIGRPENTFVGGLSAAG